MKRLHWAALDGPYREFWIKSFLFSDEWRSRNFPKTNGKQRNSQIFSYLGILIFSENHQFQECYENSGKMSQENKKEKLQTAWKDFTERPLTVHTGSSGSNHFYFQMNEDLEISQKQTGNKETLRFISYLGKLIFSENYYLQELSKDFLHWTICVEIFILFLSKYSKEFFFFERVIFDHFPTFPLKYLLRNLSNFFTWLFNFQTHIYLFWRPLHYRYRCARYFMMFHDKTMNIFETLRFKRSPQDRHYSSTFKRLYCYRSFLT